MEIDYSSNANNLSHRDRILQRLAVQGVPSEKLEQLQPGLVSFVKENKSQISELVCAILPTDEETVEAVQEGQVGVSKDFVGLGLEDQFYESMLWLQWLMFMGEPRSALKNLAEMSVGQRGVCGAVWGNNDIAYRCRTCEHDPTCAICVPCFQNGNHKDHDYSIIYTGGGCCDCGDVTAWKREGFCSKHKGAEQIQPLSEELANSVGPVLDFLFIYWKSKLLLAEAASQESPRIGHDVAELKIIGDELTSAVVELLLKFCNNSESLLCFISGRVSSLKGLLDILVRAERFLDDDVVKKLQELLLKLLGEPVFKYEFANVFLSYYPSVVSEAIRECNDNVFKKYLLLSTFSVQIFTVPTLTPRLVKEKNLLAMLLECLGNIFTSCAAEEGRLQVNKWGNLFETTLRVVEDIRFVMSHAVVTEYVTCERPDVLRTWMRLLAFVQGMNPQKRETGIHVEEENENMHLPFILCHSIANIHCLIVAAVFSPGSVEEKDDETTFDMCASDDQDNLRHAKVGRLSQESSVSSATGRSSGVVGSASSVGDDANQIPSPISWFIFECLRAIESWLGVDNTVSDRLSVLSPKTTDTSGNTSFVLKNTSLKISKGKSIFMSHDATSGNYKIRRSTEVRNRQCYSLASSTLQLRNDLGSEQSTRLDASAACSVDSTIEGDCTPESEPLRVLSLSDWPNIVYDVSSQEISVHIPLHRLLSMIIQKALRRYSGESASPNMPSASASRQLSAFGCDFFGQLLGGCHPHGFSAFIMEHPLQIRVFCAEVQAGMWRKNGDAALLSCEWYHSIRWSEQGLELDLFLLQCCAALAPTDFYVNRILERFGLSSYLSLDLERSSEYEPVLVKEMLTLIIQITKERRFCGSTTSECLQRELVCKLTVADATHSQLVKSLTRDLSKVEKRQEILDKIAVYSNPSGMNQGMYKLRQAYWKELDLYHPRWNSRDLQSAEERYFRFCGTSALTSQLPKWSKIYYPLKGVARLATCKEVLQIIRAVLFYAVFTEKQTASRAPDGVLLTALHLLSLSLDICLQHRESSDRSCFDGDSIPILAFAGEEISASLGDGFVDQSLLSLLVSLMRMHKRINPDNFMEAGSFNLPSLIEMLLKKFAELDSGCMTKLQILAPEVVNYLSQSNSTLGEDNLGSASGADMLKARARERQAAILEKMRAQQSKFLASINSSTADVSDGSNGQEAVTSDAGLDSEESTRDVCSLCHDPSSKAPVSFLILLQKSRLLSLVDRGPPSWEQVWQSEKGNISISLSSVPSGGNTLTSSSDQFNQLMQNVVNEFASDRQPREVNTFLEFIRARFPSVRNIQMPCTSYDTRERPSCSLEMLEERMYLFIREKMQEKSLFPNVAKDNEKPLTAEGPARSGNAESILLGKYIAALSKETSENPSASDNTRTRNDRTMSEFPAPFSPYDGFGPSNCDGIHLSSCGHAVHQGCLDRYLASLKERHIRRMVYEGGHIVDPDQGEFLCPVCRGLVNSALPSLPGDSRNSLRPVVTSTVNPSDTAGTSISSDRDNTSMRLQESLSLLLTAADVAGRGEILKSFPTQRNGRLRPSIESVFRVLCGLYFPGKAETISGPARISPSMIMWDTLKYSLISTEIAARCGRTSLSPNYSLTALYNELKCSSGFIMSLLLKIVRSTQVKSSISVLQRFRGIQLFAESICSGVSLNELPGVILRQEGHMLSLLGNVEMGLSFPDIQFWRRASDPILSRDAFSSLMWVLYCLPSPFLSCEESFISLVHMFYGVSVAQAIATYCGKGLLNTSQLGYCDSLITDISKIIGEVGVAQQYFVSNNIDCSLDIKDVIRRLSFPYLRRCALLLKLMSSSNLAPFTDGSQVLDRSSYSMDDMMDWSNDVVMELSEVEELEKMFKIPVVDVVLKDEVLRSLVLKWFNHFSSDFEGRNFQYVLYSTPAVPFRLMQLPNLYQDLLQRYIKQHCPECGAVLEEPALCLLCGKLCCPYWKKCCSESKCQTHAMACGGGTGVFLLIRRTTILLQRSARQAPWPSPYLDAFGEEDIEMRRGKPLYLNEERYAALCHMVASHGLDRSSKVLRQTTTGSLFLL